ncbi:MULTISPECIES: MIP/aquaporin family protein [Exiguobacterium]|uniref:MIP/aquaporin family protein n=1 Tax=Exiguobacterium antarcticum TaxID=132920 RepID=A0ABT6R5J9_9BACL|nr:MULTISPECIES: MIP/aquaporin family protein [Exiguobacterium]AFS70205.1 MIP family channel protein [Exiguobacterium antarcticum B7]MCT4780472.1 aquaporin family protein [Exiguobacterium soli]MDI3236088.1 MIP/aquaporin family protein [Exiguobacterium antarcticum]
MSNFTSELIGTMILILLGDGVVAGVVLKKTKSENSGWIVITFAWGLAVMTAVYVAAASGAHLNPAVTLSLALNSDLPWADVPVYIAAQLIGAFIGAVLVWLHYMKHFEATDDQAAKLGVFATGPAIRHTGSNLVSEIIGTFVLVFGILAFGANSFADGLNPLIVGLLVVVIGLSLGGTTGYAINPARDLGPRIAHAILPIKGKGSSDWGYSWIPVVGPFIGGAIAVFLHQMLF